MSGVIKIRAISVEQAIAALKVARDEAIARGIEVNGLHVQTDDLSQSRLTAAALAAQLDPANYQPKDATLTGLAALTMSAGTFPYTTGTDTFAAGAITAAGRALLDDADAAAQRATLGLGSAATAGFLDEDDFASDSATAAPSQQSTKAYVKAAIPSTMNASGPAPMYACRAWINFNGTGVVAIRGDGNVSSLTDVTTGTYTIGYTSALVDTNYAAAGSSQRTTDSGATAAACMFASLATTSVGMFTRTASDINQLVDSFTSCANIHR